jgi:hypothetical protein
MGSAPSCESICASAGKTFSGVDGPPGCGGNIEECGYTQAWLVKDCDCDCGGGGGGGGGSCGEYGDSCGIFESCCEGYSCEGTCEPMI